MTLAFIFELGLYVGWRYGLKRVAELTLWITNFTQMRVKGSFGLC